MYSQMLISVQSSNGWMRMWVPGGNVDLNWSHSSGGWSRKSQSPCLSRGEKYRSFARVPSSSARTPRMTPVYPFCSSSCLSPFVLSAVQQVTRPSVWFIPAASASLFCPTTRLRCHSLARRSRYSIIAGILSVSYTHLRAHETPEHLVCRLLLE